MKLYYVLFKLNPDQLPYTDKPNTPWRLFWSGDDPEMAWRQFGLFHKESPFRVYRNTKVQLRSMGFKNKPVNSDYEKPEDYDYKGTR